MTLEDLRERTRARISDIRRLEYIYELPGFETMFLKNESRVLLLTQKAEEGDVAARIQAIEELRAMLRKENKLEESMRDLKAVASAFGIERYSRMSKEALQSAVEKERQRHDSKNIKLDNRNPGHTDGLRIQANGHSLQNGAAGESRSGGS